MRGLCLPLIRAAVVVCAAALLASTAAAQAPSPVVKGTVSDEGGSPLSGVTVTLEGPTGPPRTTTTDSKGQYVFGDPGPGPWKVSVALPGFTSQSAHGAAADASFTLRLMPLEQLVASASHKAKTLRDAPATAWVVTDTQIRERGYSFLFDALRDAPGLDVIWMGGLYGPILMPRGLDQQENNRVLVLVDGVVDNNLSAGTAQVYMQYSLHNVKRIEVIYGPASALYGANAMGGLINIITRNGEDLRGLRAEVGGLAWDPQFRRGGGLAAVAAGKAWGEEGHKVDLSASFNVVATDGPDLRLHSDEARSDDPAHPGASAYYFSPDYVGAAEKGTWMGQARASFQQVGLTLGGFAWQHDGGLGTYAHEGYVALNALQDRADVWNYRNAAAYASWNRKLGGRVSNTLGLTWRKTELTDGYDMYFDAAGTGPNGPGSRPGAGGRYLRPDHSVKVEDTASWDISDRMSLTAGLSGEFQRVSDYMTAGPPGTPTPGLSFVDQRLIAVAGEKPVVDESHRYDNRDWSGYAEHNWAITDKLSLTTGVRVDAFQTKGDSTPFVFGTHDTDAGGACPADRPFCRTAAEAAAAGATEVSRVYYQFQEYDKTRTSVNPRVGAVYKASPSVTLKALYGEGFRMPTVRELFSVSGSRVSSPDLGAEKIRTGEVSATYQLPRERGVLEADVFVTEAKDLIVLIPGSIKRPGRSSFLNQFQNVGEPRMAGFELKAQLNVGSSVDLFGHYGFNSPKWDAIDPGNLSHDPHDAKATSDAIPRQARHKGMVGGVVSLARGRLVLSPRLNWVGARPAVVTSPLLEAPAYAMLNLAVTARDLGVKGLWVQAVAWNLTNSDILDPGFRTASKANDFPAAHPQPGVNFVLRVGYRTEF